MHRLYQSMTFLTRLFAELTPHRSNLMAFPVNAWYERSPAEPSLGCSDQIITQSFFVQSLLYLKPYTSCILSHCASHYQTWTNYCSFRSTVTPSDFTLFSANPFIVSKMHYRMKRLEEVTPYKLYNC